MEKRLRRKISLLIAGIFIITGCATKQTPPPIGKKVIPNEDEYIIKALLAEDSGEFNKSIAIYKYLYQKTKKPVYYEKIVEDLFRERKFDEVIKKAEEFNEEHFDKKIFEYEIFALLEKKEYEKAKNLLKEKFNKKDEFYYMMMSYILIKQNRLDEAVYYLKSLYALNHSKNVLLELSDVLIRLKKYNEALAYLRTHLDLYGCDFDVCKRLAVIYKQTYDYDNLANIYEKLGIYDEKYLVYAINIYMENGEYKKAINLIKKYGLNKEYLMMVYVQEKKFRKASAVAYELYEKTSNPKYLLKYCEYLYYDHPTKEEIKDIAKKLEYLIAFYPNAYLYNFLGYVLIDNDINVKKGLYFVQKAVELQPENIEYIDSLAWGYYKLGKCKEAWDIIRYIQTKDKEILKHKRLIEKCVRRGKREGEMVK